MMIIILCLSSSLEKESLRIFGNLKNACAEICFRVLPGSKTVFSWPVKAGRGNEKERSVMKVMKITGIELIRFLLSEMMHFKTKALTFCWSCFLSEDSGLRNIPHCCQESSYINIHPNVINHRTLKNSCTNSRTSCHFQLSGFFLSGLSAFSCSCVV